MLLDAHAHLDIYSDDQIDSVIKQINKEKIFTLSVGMDPASYKRNLELSGKSELILPAFGIHPWNASEYAGRMDELKPLIDQSSIIGEIGLDYRFVEDDLKYPTQRYVFEYFLKAAREQNKIINLHISGAEKEVLAMLGCYGLNRAIIHWYSGPTDVLNKYLEQEIYFTLGVEVLFSKHIWEICKMIPDHLLLTETDNPGGYKWLTKKQGMPSLIKDVIAKIAEIKNNTPNEIESMVWRNFQALIKDDPHLKLNSV